MKRSNHRTWKSYIQRLVLAFACILNGACAPVNVEEIEDEGQSSYQISTPSADWVYHKTGGGFSSLIDKSGNDWIGYHPEGREMGEFRGIPNLVFRSKPKRGFFHPGHSGDNASETTLVKKNRTHAIFQSKSRDGKWHCEWEILPDRALFRLIELPDNDDNGYWFLYEGTPGGSFNPNDLCLRSDGTLTMLSESWETNSLQNPWTAFISPSSGHSLLILSHNAPEVPVSYRSLRNGMTVFGFGRALGSVQNLLNTPVSFTVALVDEVEPKQIAAIAQAMGTPSRKQR